MSLAEPQFVASPFFTNIWPSSFDLNPSVVPSLSSLHRPMDYAMDSRALSSPHETSTRSRYSPDSLSAGNASLPYWPSDDARVVSPAYAEPWSQTSSGSSLSYENNTQGLACYPPSTVPLTDLDLTLSPVQASTLAAPDSFWDSVSNWPTLQELLAAPIMDISLDPTLETTVHLGYLENSAHTSAQLSSNMPLPVYSYNPDCSGQAFF
ncbi:hypothetical protein EIP86_004979 [Pleurotus ostreatoroseus]|nr:hypothetical protein EIP86_004979 [Pleurotus ostreatoroseus]